MKLTVIFLLLAGSALAQRRRTLEPQPTDQTPENTSKRALLEGNAGVGKRAPVLPTALPSITPGIEYATTKGPLSENTEENYVDDLPDSFRPAVAKISDFLSGRGSAFPDAIHNNLYAPVSAYKNRLVNPQTYEISAPVPSQLAYSEHKISYQPTQYKQNIYRPIQQLLPPEQVVYSHQPAQHSRQNYQQQVQPRFTYNHVPPVQPHFSQPIIYSRTQIRNPFQVQTHNFLQQVDPQVLPVHQHHYNNQYYKNTKTYFPQDQPVLIPQGTGIPSIEVVQSLEPGIMYAKQEVRPQPTAKEPQTVTESPVKVPEKQIVNQHQNQLSRPQGAVSYASFSVGPPAQVNFLPQPTQPGVSIPQQRGQLSYNPAASYQPQQTGIIAPQHFEQPQFQFKALAPKSEQQFIQDIDPQPIRSLSQSPHLSYFRPGLSLYRNFYAPDSLQNQDLVLQNPSVPSQNLSPIALPPVQFFGKFAHSIFGAQYAQQQPQQQQNLEQQQQPQQLLQQHQPPQQLLQSPQQLLQQQQPPQQLVQQQQPTLQLLYPQLSQQQQQYQPYQQHQQQQQQQQQNYQNQQQLQQ